MDGRIETIERFGRTPHSRVARPRKDRNHRKVWPRPIEPRCTTAKGSKPSKGLAAPHRAAFARPRKDRNRPTHHRNRPCDPSTKGAKGSKVASYYRLHARAHVWRITSRQFRSLRGSLDATLLTTIALRSMPALDLGQATGWAVRDADRVNASGTAEAG